MSEANEDIPIKAWAIVWDPEQGWYMLTPQLPDDDILPDEAAALSAAFIRLTGYKRFFSACLRWLDKDMQANGIGQRH